LALATLCLAFFGGWGLLIALRDWVIGYAWYDLALNEGNIWFGVPWIMLVGTLWAGTCMGAQVCLSWLVLFISEVLPEDQPEWLRKKVDLAVDYATIFI
jgi:hypothetical protein